VLDDILSHLGLGTPVVLGTPVPAIIALMVADIWKTTPFVAIIVLAGLMMLPRDLFEAAEVDGATGWSTFWRITFPLLRSTIALAVLFRMLQAFGLFDLPFVLTNGAPGHSTTSLAIFGYWILRNYFLAIPHEMEESARIDGASPVRTLWSVILPQAWPGLFTAGIFTFTACWAEFLMALTFNNSNDFRTIPVGVALFGSQFTVPYGTIFAASVVAVVPIGILVFVFGRSVVSGLTAGAVKG
jgi:ABC-type glycerol-3-phosphate transport system permease component